MLAGRLAMAAVCVIGVIALKPEDYRPQVFIFKAAGIILIAVLWSYIVEHLVSEYKKKRNAIRLGG